MKAFAGSAGRVTWASGGREPRAVAVRVDRLAVLWVGTALMAQRASSPAFSHRARSRMPTDRIQFVTRS